MTGLDRAVADAAADLRTPTLVDVAKAVDLLTAVPLIMALRWGTVLALAVLGRFRHLVVFLTTFVVTDWVVARALHVALAPPDVTGSPTPERTRSRPVDRGARDHPRRYLARARPTRSRSADRVVARAWNAPRVVVAELILATDYVIPMAYSWLFAARARRGRLPNVRTRGRLPGDAPAWGERGTSRPRRGERGEAIVRAMRDQLGMTVTKVEPFGLEGSGGSSPLRMTFHDGTRVFAKVYSTSHARADRWYRVIREVLYGQLEDETPMASVRRLVTYEDYALRSLRDAGVGVARTYGVVELSPNREYMLVTQFFEGGRNLSDSDVDDTVIDEGLDSFGVSGTRGSPTATEACEPPGRRGPPTARGRLGPGGAAVAVAPGRRPGEHDALSRATHRRGPRVSASDIGLHARRDRGGVRERGGARDPDGAVGEAQGRRASADRSVQRTRPRARPGLDPAMSPRRAALTAAVGTAVLVLAGMLVDSVRAG